MNHSPEAAYGRIADSQDAPNDSVAYGSLHDNDVALGCECAEPALQIETWDRDRLDLFEA